MTGTGTGPIMPLPHQTIVGSKPVIGPPSENNSVSPRKTESAAERDDEGRHLQPGDAEPLQQAAEHADRDRRQHARQTSHSRRPLPPRATAVAERALRHRRGDHAGERQHRADREVDAGREDDERHAERDEPVIEICRITLNRFVASRNRGSSDGEDDHHDAAGRSAGRSGSASFQVDWRRRRLVAQVDLIHLRHLTLPYCPLSPLERHQAHEPLLGGLGGRDLAGHPALAHGDDAVADRPSPPAAPTRWR